MVVVATVFLWEENPNRKKEEGLKWGRARKKLHIKKRTCTWKQKSWPHIDKIDTQSTLSLSLSLFFFFWYQKFFTNYYFVFSTFYSFIIYSSLFHSVHSPSSLFSSLFCFCFVFPNRLRSAHQFPSLPCLLYYPLQVHTNTDTQTHSVTHIATKHQQHSLMALLAWLKPQRRVKWNTVRTDSEIYTTTTAVYGYLPLLLLLLLMLRSRLYSCTAVRYSGSNRASNRRQVQLQQLFTLLLGARIVPATGHKGRQTQDGSFPSYYLPTNYLPSFIPSFFP